MNVTKIFFKTIQIILGFIVVSFAALLFYNHFGNTKFFYPYVVQSGSMEPAIMTGSVIFSLPQKNYLRGDVITFAPNPSEKRLVTHRIAYKNFPDGIHGEPTYLTSGDANEEIDRWEISQNQIIGKVAFTIPYLGYAVDFAKTPQGFILFVIIPATIVIYEELKNILSEIKKGFVSLFAARKKKEETTEESTDHNTKKVTPPTKALIIFPVLGACIVLVAFTKAYLFDTEKTGTNTIGVSTTYTPTPPQETLVLPVDTGNTLEQNQEIQISEKPTEPEL